MQTLIINIKELLQVRENHIDKVSGDQMAILPTLKNAFLLLENDLIKISAHSQLAEKIEIVLKNGKPFYEDALNKAATELCWENEEPKLLQLFKKVTDENF